MVANNELVKEVRPSHFIFMFDVSSSMTRDNSEKYFKEFMDNATDLGENNIMSIFKFHLGFEKIISKEKVSVLANRKNILG